MPGAGTGTLVACGEQSFMGSLVDADSDGTPDLFHLGRNPTLSEGPSLENQLQELREADAAWSVESVKQNFEGSITIEAIVSADVHTKLEDALVLNAADTIQPGLSTSGRVFAGVQYPTGTALEEYLGCIPLQYDINWQQGGEVQYTLSLAYADQKPDPSTDLTTATPVTDGSSVAWHGTDLSIDGTTVSDMQSATLSLSDLARFQRGGTPTPNRGVTAAPSATLDVEATFVEETRMDLARGSSTSAPPDTLDSVAGALTLNAPDGTTLRTYNLAKLKPDSHQWNEIIGTEDATDATTFNVNGDPAVTFA